MYRIEERENAIATIQRYLLIISQVDPMIPHLAVDGIYGEETSLAVIEYQKSRALAPSGVVDRVTFDLLFYEADEIMKNNGRRSSVLNEENFPLKLGDSGHDVNNLNNMLRTLSVDFLNIIALPYGSFFSKDTEDAVKTMQIIFRETPDGLVTLKLYDRLDNEVQARKSIRKIKEMT